MSRTFRKSSTSYHFTGWQFKYKSTNGGKSIRDGQSGFDSRKKHLKRASVQSTRNANRNHIAKIKQGYDPDNLYHPEYSDTKRLIWDYM